ncbi:hypothetical protein HS7_16390 [Sulfolobales archaeon HS-7]|nr:hypothetical protein HS7_16390 [Sulfolobales archaeon HS-7]
MSFIIDLDESACNSSVKDIVSYAEVFQDITFSTSNQELLLALEKKFELKIVRREGEKIYFKIVYLG